MQVAGIVAISICVGLLLAALLAGIAVTIMCALRIRASAILLEQQLKKFYAENCQELADHRGQLERISESAKSNFKGVREEMRGSLDLVFKTMRETLASHEKIIEAAVGKINATELLTASKRGVEACLRLERIAVAMERWRLAAEGEEVEELLEEEPVQAGKPWPESRANEYAPPTPGPSIYSKTRPDDVLQSQVDEGERVPVAL